VALAALALALVALATWGWLQRNGQGTQASQASQDILPKDAVALVNSTTPIPERHSPLTVRDEVNEIPYAPDSLGWSAALREADRARREGRYSQAIGQYSALVGDSDLALSHDALWGLAGTYEDAGFTELAIRSYALFTYLRDDPRSARAFFKIAQLQEQSLLWHEASQSYSEYANHAGPAKHTALLLKARLLGNSPDSADVYKAILADSPSDPDQRATLLGLAQVRAALAGSARSAGASTTAQTPTRTTTADDDAVKLYDGLAELQVREPRPALDQVGEPSQVLAAREMAARGDKAEAHKRLFDYINGRGDYAYGRYSALDALLELEPTAVVSGTIPPLRAARIAYEARYFGPAIGFMDALRVSSTDPVERAQAAFLTGKAFEASGDPASAYNWYTATVQTYPQSPEAPEAMRRAGDALVDQAAWDAALGTFQQGIAQYPNTPETDKARISAGLLAYRLEQKDLALQLLSPLDARQALSPTLKAQAAFWAAKVQKSLGNPGWQSGLLKVTANAPGSYLDFRARSLLSGEPDGGPVAPTFTQSSVLPDSFGVQYDKEANERRDLLTWAANITSTNTLTSTPTVNATLSPQSSVLSPDAMTQRLVDDPEMQRAVALVRLGDERGGYAAVRALAERLRDEKDASGLAQLVIYLRYHAVPRTAMRAADELAGLAGGDPLKLPTLLLKTLYPTPYSDLVTQEARQRDIDPLVVYALMRQESEFVPGALSHADARGLAQVIPSTAQGIADQLGDKDYRAADLYLPYVSIRYGTYYLASNMPQFDRKLLPTLAAYNGGPGNADRWLSGSALFDPDLYVPRIDLFETGDYLERVYENYGYYRQIYGTH
jgi:soluble lytic murein transglycosylase